MLTFDFSHELGVAAALERLLAAAPTEGIEVTWPDGAPTSETPAGEVVAPSPLGPVRARFTIHPRTVAIEVTEAPRFVPDALVRAAMEAKLERALG